MTCRIPLKENSIKKWDCEQEKQGEVITEATKMQMWEKQCKVYQWRTLVA